MWPRPTNTSSTYYHSNTSFEVPVEINRLERCSYRGWTGDALMPWEIHSGGTSATLK